MSDFMVTEIPDTATELPKSDRLQVGHGGLIDEAIVLLKRWRNDSSSIIQWAYLHTETGEFLKKLGVL